MQHFWRLYLKVIVIMNCLEIQPLLENFLRILNITQSTSGMLRLSDSSPGSLQLPFPLLGKLVEYMR